MCFPSIKGYQNLYKLLKLDTQDDDLGMDLGLGEEATHSNEIIEEEYHFEVNITLFERI